jgi:hypothetical protein
MKRNFRYNQRGGVDCEIRIGYVAEVPAQDEILNDEGNIIQHAQAHIPAQAGEWHPHTCDEIPDGVDIAPYVPPPKTKEQLLSELAALRYEKEVGGIDFNGYLISTKREDVDGYYKIHKSLEKGWITSTPLTKGDASITVNLAVMESLLAAISVQTAAIFDKSDKHLAKIKALDSQSKIDKYDISKGW